MRIVKSPRTRPDNHPVQPSGEQAKEGEQLTRPDILPSSPPGRPDILPVQGTVQQVPPPLTRLSAKQSSPSTRGKLTVQLGGQSRSIPCKHLGAETGLEHLCKTCGGNIRLKEHLCTLHAVCVLGRGLPGVFGCLVCPDYVMES